jgi:hypothetical protein
MKVLKIVGVGLLGISGLVVLLYLIGLAVNWRDQPPSKAALQIKQILADRAPVADADNGFVYAMGFSVPAPADPQSAGALRTAWLEAVNRDPEQIDADPVKKDVSFNAAVSRSMERVKGACTDAHSGECRDAYLAALPQPRTTLEELQLTRYRALLQRPAWREVVPLDIRMPIARFGDIIGGQRLLFVDLGARAKSAPPAEIAQALNSDLAFWREVQKSSDYLITKMIAVAALRQHFFFGTLVLREMPAGQAEVIGQWSVPFSTEELSMRRTMAGELTFAEGQMGQWTIGADLQTNDPDDPRLTLRARIATVLARPFFQRQDQINYYAAEYLDFTKRFEVPIDRYFEVEAAVEALRPEMSLHVYNLTGHIFRGLSGTWNFTSYAIRVGSIEGMRRAALLTAQLRDRAVPLENMAKEVSGAGLRDPFDREPFEWDTEGRAVVYVGPDAERDRQRHPYFY